MMASDQNAALAVLIDGDNASPKVIRGLLAEITNYGIASVKRVYGDWTQPNLKGWKECLLEHSIQPVQQFAYTKGKNATDGAMIIDAMDLLYTGRFSGFCIVSSDSDFTRLAARIREQGITVYGFGARKTPRPFITACDKFVYYDILEAVEADQGDAQTSNAQPRQQPKLEAKMLKTLSQAIAATLEDDGRAQLSRIGSYLAKQSPDFDSRNFGFQRLVDLVEASGLVLIERTGQSGMVIRVRPVSGSKLKSDK